jgi:hypothetical protein
MNLEESSVEDAKFGSGDSPIIGFAMRWISCIIGITFIKIPWSAGWLTILPSTGIAPRFRDSNLTRGPQRLKP